MAWFQWGLRYYLKPCNLSWLEFCCFTRIIFVISSIYFKCCWMINIKHFYFLNIYLPFFYSGRGHSSNPITPKNKLNIFTFNSFWSTFFYPRRVFAQNNSNFEFTLWRNIILLFITLLNGNILIFTSSIIFKPKKFLQNFPGYYTIAKHFFAK